MAAGDDKRSPCAEYVVPAHMADADVWTRIEWLLGDMRDDDLNSGVPRYQPRYTQREQEICHLLGFGYKALREAIDRHDADREMGRCDAPNSPPDARAGL